MKEILKKQKIKIKIKEKKRERNIKKIRRNLYNNLI